jgi:hypothetical protein
VIHVHPHYIDCSDYSSETNHAEELPIILKRRKSGRRVAYYIKKKKIQVRLVAMLF